MTAPPRQTTGSSACCCPGGVKRPPPRRCAKACLTISLASCLLAAQFGCATPQTDRSPRLDFTLPQNWANAGLPGASNSGGASSLADWWLRFNDPLLSRLIDQALQANTSVKSAAAGLRQARALSDLAAAGLRPTLGSSASATRSKLGRNPPANHFAASLDASWELDIFGATRNTVNAAKANTQASEASLGEVQVSIAAEVALTYIALRGAQTRLAITRQHLDSLQETLQITRWHLEAGLVTALESEQAISASAQTHAQLPVLQTSIAQSSHALSVLTGQPPAALTAQLAPPPLADLRTIDDQTYPQAYPLASDPPVPPVPYAADQLTLAIPAETLRQRPDVRATEYQVSAAAAQVDSAQAAHLPSFRIGGSLGVAAATVGALGSGAAVLGSVLAGVSLPIFDGGSASAQVSVQQTVLEQAILTYQAAVLNALREVEDALVAQQGDGERLARLQEAAVAASNAALMASQRYLSGLTDFQIVLETQRTLLNTLDNVAITRAELAADQVRLYKALGGGWRLEADEQHRNPPAKAPPGKPSDFPAIPSTPSVPNVPNVPAVPAIPTIPTIPAIPANNANAISAPAAVASATATPLRTYRP